jgi:hypothetical protein
MTPGVLRSGTGLDGSTRFNFRETASGIVPGRNWGRNWGHHGGHGGGHEAAAPAIRAASGTRPGPGRMRTG